MKVTVCGNDAHITIDNSGEGEWTLYVGKVRFGEPTLTVNQKTQYEEITLKKE